MTPKVKRAIGQLRSTRGDGGHVTGTAFVVGDRYLLTAFHVVGDRGASVSSGAPLCYPTLQFHLGGVAAGGITARPVPGCCDAVADWALLELDTPLVGVTPIPLGEVSQREMDRLRPSERTLGFETWGLPRQAQMNGTGISLDGRVQDRNGDYQGAWVYELYSDHAAAALGEPLNGLSGAPCIIDGAAVGIIRSNLLGTSQTHGIPAHVIAGTLYACPIATPSLQDCCAQYLPPLDPIRGLPGLPRRLLPLQPFRYLHWYGAEYAEVFFGRDSKIRKLYFQVTGDDVPPVVLVYGPSGVGKSSLLEAGLLPRLAWNYTVHAQRRDAGKTLVQTFDTQLTIAQQANLVDRKRIVILLDQIEEVFTDPAIDGNAEMVALAQRIKTVLTQTAQPVSILLGFRSEWLANIRSRIVEAEVPVSEFFLERFTHDEIEEVVAGVASTERLRQFYGVAVEDGLPHRVADDLLRDPQSPVSPVLSIILTRLWEEARTLRADEKRLSTDAYERRMRTKLDLHRFLSEQIQVLAETRGEDVMCGLVNDVLYRHTTDLGTAKDVPWSNLCRAYCHLTQEDDTRLAQLIKALSDVSLLYAVDTNNHSDEQRITPRVTRLAHDTLALPVRRNYQASDLPGQRAQRILDSRGKLEGATARGGGNLITFSESDIETILSGQPGMGTISPNLLNQIQREQQEYYRLRQERLNLAIHNAEANIEHLRFEIALKNLKLASLEKIADQRIWDLAWQLPYPLGQLGSRSDLHEVMGLLGEQQAPHDLERDNRTKFFPVMAEVTRGEFDMGSEEGGERERPIHKICLNSFLMGVTPITWYQYGLFCLLTGRTFPNDSGFGRGNRPVINVSWYDAVEYCNWISDKLSPIDGIKLHQVYSIRGEEVIADWSKNGFRLPTEAEWEYAARQGGQNTRFGTGMDIADPSRMNFDAGNKLNKQHPQWYIEGKGLRATSLVRHYPANALGLYDMSGNVWDWCWDWYSDGNNHFFTISDGAVDPVGPASGEKRVVRGGSWLSEADYCRCSFRGRYRPLNCSDYIGFRVARGSIRPSVV